jgi:hypothetical protein
MSDSLPKRSSPAPSKTSRAEFNWPPTDEELADCFYSGPPREQGASPGVEALQETVTDGPTETSLNACETEASTHSSCTPEDAGSDRLSAAVLAHEAVPDRAGKNQWAAEIAHLQALIEALTEKVEWRIPNDPRR